MARDMEEEEAAGRVGHRRTMEKKKRRRKKTSRLGDTTKDWRRSHVRTRILMVYRSRVYGCIYNTGLLCPAGVVYDLFLQIRMATTPYAIPQSSCAPARLSPSRHDALHSQVPSCRAVPPASFITQTSRVAACFASYDYQAIGRVSQTTLP